MRLCNKLRGEGMDAFIQVFTDAYKRVIGGELTADTMPLLTGEQHSLLAYQIFRDDSWKVVSASWYKTDMVAISLPIRLPK